MEWQQSFPPLDTEFLLIFQKNRVDFDVEKQESPNIVLNFLNASQHKTLPKYGFKQESNIVLNFFVDDL